MKKTVFTGMSGLLVFLFYMAWNISLAAEDPLTIVVTAARSAETVDDTLAPVTIIGRDEIERSGALGVADILTRVPGLVVSNNGGAGKNTSVFLRGTESDHVLVLIDGVKVGSASLGTTPFHDIPAGMIEKIEVVRGPRSSLYGSEAIGGVIQIFTRKGGNGTRPSFGVSAGSHQFFEVQGGVSGGNAQSWYNLNVSRSSTDGIDACRGSFNAGCFTVEPDDDGYENTALSARAGIKLNQNSHIEFGLLNSDNETNFDGAFQNQSETLTQTTHIKGLFEVRDNWDSSLLYSQSRDESDNFLDGSFASRFDTERTQISWLNDIFVGNHRIVLGVDYLDDEVDSSTPFTVSNRDNIGVFVSLNSRIANHDFEVSLRGDDNEQFGSKTTGGVAIGHDLANGNRLTLSYGTAFKAPSFNELYFPGFGNPNLNAETSSSFDLGLSGGSGSHRWSINGFSTEIDDVIGFDPLTFTPVNINQAKIIGVEFLASTEIAGWLVSGNLTLQDPEDSSDGFNQGKQLPRRAKRVLNLGVNRSIGKWRVSGSLLSKGNSYDDLGNAIKLGSFNVINVRTDYRVRPNWDIGLQINNLFDEDYETAAFFNQDGVNGLLTIRYVPD